ncbi:hypothetical protein OAA91_01875 [Fibrobacterales bacterium]|nr:hypothetical protein [Fibrobacterales bacterium]
MTSKIYNALYTTFVLLGILSTFIFGWLENLGKEPAYAFGAYCIILGLATPGIAILSPSLTGWKKKTAIIISSFFSLLYIFAVTYMSFFLNS